MNKKEYLIITFQETTMALYMERVCKKYKQDGRLIPLPKEIDAGCGLAWATLEKNNKRWLEFLDEYGIQYDQMVEVMI
ncbi:MAG: DUF3343 domain-containing protein [Faecalibacillus sp.]